MKIDRTIAALALAACMAPALGAGAYPERQDPEPKPQQTYLLRDTVAPGDTAKVTADFQAKMNVLASTSDGAESPNLSAYNGVQRAYTRTILSVGPKGESTGERLLFTRSRTMNQQPGAKMRTTVASYEGKSLTVKRVGGRVVVTPAKGRISAAERADLQSLLSEASQAPFPDYPLYLGEEWTIDSPAFARAVGGGESASVSGRLVELTQRGGHPCVRAHVTIDLAARPPGLAELTLKLEGDVIYALDIKRTLSINLAGPITMSGELYQGNRMMVLSGDGRATLKLNMNWTRVGGKPVKTGAK